ncbi:MAG: hypothetical protein PVH68_17150 [Armatimonadota bacterium]|jgi:hypothetical protein
MQELHITVRDVAGLSMLRPVTGGVPLAEGAAPEGSVFILRDDARRSIPLQTSVLARWKDGSARWVLLDFQSRPSANGEREYILSWQGGGQSTQPDAGVAVREGDRPLLLSGGVALAVGDRGLLSISERVDVELSLTDAEGQACAAAVESAEVETVGALRSTLSLVGSFRAPAGGRVFQFRMRASVYAGLPVIRLEPMILVDAERDIIQRIRELKLTLASRNGTDSVRLGGTPGWEGAPDRDVRLFQYDDEQYRIEGGEGEGGKAPGWAAMDDGEGAVAVALRDFWQQWPKSLEASTEALAIGLFPRFNEGDYAHMEPWYKYQYLFDGDCYQLRTGQARRWDVWVGLDGDGESLAKSADAPLIPIPDPAEAIATGVWDAIAPAGTPEMAEYDAWAENLFDAYCNSIVVQRDYGQMNWGDWFGERRVNWGNHEYDTTNQLLIQFARTGDPKYFYVADTAARHSSEVDTVHHVSDDLATHFDRDWQNATYPPRAGMVHQHAVGHVGSFYPVERMRELYIEHGIGRAPKPYLCLDPRNLGHLWTQGTVRHYFLTGDPFLRETVERIGENLAQLVEDRKYKFMGHTHCGRTTGWPLLALAGAYEIGLSDRYLSAMKTLADDALADQDPVCGGWLIHPMAPDHCICKTARHTGMAGFITAVLINGLSRYYLLTGDERLPDAIERAVTFLDNDTWREERRDWRYTSCPATRPTGQPGVVVMAHVNAIRIANNAEHLRVLRIAWDTKFRRLLEAPKPRPGFGKSYTSTMYGCAEAVGLLAAAEDE